MNAGSANELVMADLVGDRRVENSDSELIVASVSRMTTRSTA
jgi:hypothetical protein